MKNLFFLLLIAGLWSCGNSETAPVVSTTGSTAGYEITEIPGTPLQNAEKKDVNGTVTERGQFLNGQKTGTWVEYYPDKGFPKKVATYANGQFNGQYMELSSRGQIEMMANYRNNKLDGTYGLYKFGRPTETIDYKNGERHGVYKSYFNNSDKLQKEVNYLEGVQHGPFRQYNEEGEVVLEYEYKNGEVVGGGMVREN